jgi:hypothetical protein
MPPVIIAGEKLGAADKHTCNPSHYTWISILPDSPLKRNSQDQVWDRISCFISIGTGKRPKGGTLKAHGLTGGLRVLQGLANDCEDAHRSMVRCSDASGKFYMRIDVPSETNFFDIVGWNDNNVRSVEEHAEEYV